MLTIYIVYILYSFIFDIYTSLYLSVALEDHIKLCLAFSSSINYWNNPNGDNKGGSQKQKIYIRTSKMVDLNLIASILHEM